MAKVHGATINAARKRFSSAAKLNPEEHSKKELVRNILLVDINAKRKDVAAFYGEDVQFIAESTFYQTRKEILENAQIERVVGKYKGGNGKLGIPVDLDAHDDELVGDSPDELDEPVVVKPDPVLRDEEPPAQDTPVRDEIAYLRWALLGERFGWVERYLKERTGDVRVMLPERTSIHGFQHKCG